MCGIMFLDCFCCEGAFFSCGTAWVLCLEGIFADDVEACRS